MTFTQGYVLVVVIFLVYALYKEVFNPAFSFFICTVALLLANVITPSELIKGLSNQQIIVIFLLVLVTAGIRIIFGTELFTKLFNTKLKPKVFLFRMMLTVSPMSAFLNNTPIVAFMIPYVKDWAEKTGNPASKFLIPLSFATILGGMITVIGTSTNLVLAGLIAEYKLPALQFQDFLYLGIMVTLAGWIYLYYIGYHLLPSNSNKIDELRENLKEYIVETEIFPGSSLIGKTVKEAGLRNLQDQFLVEILRDEKVISPVSPDEILQQNDLLYFSGNTQAIYNLIKEDNGLHVPKQEKLETEEQFNFVEAVIPANSDLIGVRIKDSDFRKKYNSSIIAIHRNGKQVSGKVGEMELAGGDFLLLLSGGQNNARSFEKDLFFLSIPQKLTTQNKPWLKWVGFATFAFLISGIVGLLPLFTVCVGILMGLVMFGILNVTEIKRELDLSLLMVLVCSLAIGIALEKSGAAQLVATLIIDIGIGLGPVAVLAALFFVTILLTALVTNAAAVSIMFPIAMSLAAQLALPSTPFFVAIAFAASGDFMTPIGYQTNLMVYGPGGYTFKDFLKVGTIFTIIYIVVCVGFLSYFYNLY
ncbi:MAG: SLC13 family permease [Cyclobacteriaceae bacterium]|nr:SLC13 family permease [Cyclobacteriaceae bacterium]